jgi:hypothetical protein
MKINSWIYLPKNKWLIFFHQAAAYTLYLEYFVCIRTVPSPSECVWMNQSVKSDLCLSSMVVGSPYTTVYCSFHIPVWFNSSQFISGSSTIHQFQYYLTVKFRTGKTLLRPILYIIMYKVQLYNFKIVWNNIKTLAEHNMHSEMVKLTGYMNAAIREPTMSKVTFNTKIYAHK